MNVVIFIEQSRTQTGQRLIVVIIKALIVKRATFHVN